MEAIEKKLRVMDMTAISLAMDNNLPLVIFNLSGQGDLKRLMCGEDVGSRID